MLNVEELAVDGCKLGAPSPEAQDTDIAVARKWRCR
jgi:hypothetical protein